MVKFAIRRGVILWGSGELLKFTFLLYLTLELQIPKNDTDKSSPPTLKFCWAMAA